MYVYVIFLNIELFIENLWDKMKEQKEYKFCSQAELHWTPASSMYSFCDYFGKLPTALFLYTWAVIPKLEEYFRNWR